MNVGELREILSEWPDEYTVEIDISLLEDIDIDEYYDIIDVEWSPQNNKVYIVAED